MNFKKLLIIPIVALLIGCSADPELGPIITVDKAEIGAFPRLVQLITGEYDLANISSSSYAHEVEFQSEDAGQNIASYEITAAYNGGTPQVFKTFGQGDFGDSALGLRGITVTIPLTEVASFVGVSLDDLQAGDAFNFTSSVTLDDGRVFGDGNTESTIKSSAFRAYFNWNVLVTCPLPDDLFTGSYNLVYEESDPGGYGPAWPEGDVDITVFPGSTTKREFSTIYLPGIGGFGPYQAVFDIVCDKVVFEGMVSGVGCGGGSLTVGPIPGMDSPADITDDSQIVLYMNEGFNTAGCASVSANMVKVVLTKN
jgi:hypothetical protein